MSLIERLKLGSELKSTLSIGKLFQRFMTRSAKKVGSDGAIAEMFENLARGLSSFSLFDKIYAVQAHSATGTRYAQNPLDTFPQAQGAKSNWHSNATTCGQRNSNPDLAIVSRAR